MLYNISIIIISIIIIIYMTDGEIILSLGPIVAAQINLVNSLDV